MQILWRDARAWSVALAMSVCVLTGCATNGASHSVKSSGNAPMPDSTVAEPLTAEQQRQAQALAHYATGEILGNEKGDEEALAEYRKSLALNPHNPVLALRIAQVYLNRRDVTNAVAVLESAVKLDPGSADAWYGLGVVYRRYDSPKAIAAWRQALKADPTSANAIRALVEEYLLHGTAADIAGVVQPALKQTSKDPMYWMSLGDTLSIALRQTPSLWKQIGKASVRQCYEKALALSPNDLDIQARVAESYADSGEFQMAADVYAKLLKARPGNPILLDRLWRMYAQSDQKEKAVATLEQILKRDPLRFEVYNALGDLYEELDKTDRAIANYQQSLILNPNQLNLYVHIALAQMRIRKFKDASTTLESAKEKFPTKYQVPYLTGLLLSDEKQYTNAVASFGDAETLAREDPEESKLSSAFYFSYGSACERAGDEEKAASLFRKAIDLDPNNHNAYNYLGYMWADKGLHLDESMELIQKALKLEPDNGAYLDSFGWVLYRMGRYEEALPNLQRAVTLMKKEDEQEDATVLDHLAEVLLKLNKRDEAVDAWRRALKVDPDNKDIAGKLQKYNANHPPAPTSSAVPPESQTR
jgi:tetratricopeptide (TPR) repeat protein